MKFGIIYSKKFSDVLLLVNINQKGLRFERFVTIISEHGDDLYIPKPNSSNNVGNEKSVLLW